MNIEISSKHRFPLKSKKIDDNNDNNIYNLVSVNHMAILANPDLAKFPNMESFCFKKPVIFKKIFINYFI